MVADILRQKTTEQKYGKIQSFCYIFVLMWAFLRQFLLPMNNTTNNSKMIFSTNKSDWRCFMVHRFKNDKVFRIGYCMIALV